MTNTFLDKLRGDTAVMHKALEQNGYTKALMSPSVSLDDYADYLEKMYGFVKLFETNVLPLIQQYFPGYQHKASLLEADLAGLGRPVENVPLLQAYLLEEYFTNEARALGGLYVMEGSTLGGMVIYKHLHDQLGDAVEGKANYFTVYGNSTGTRWKHFLETFCSLASRPGKEEQEVIEGAINTFRLLREWMEEKYTMPLR